MLHRITSFPVLLVMSDWRGCCMVSPDCSWYLRSAHSVGLDGGSAKNEVKFVNSRSRRIRRCVSDACHRYPRCGRPWCCEVILWIPRSMSAPQTKQV